MTTSTGSTRIGVWYPPPENAVLLVPPEALKFFCEKGKLRLPARVTEWTFRKGRKSYILSGHLIHQDGVGIDLHVGLDGARNGKDGGIELHANVLGPDWITLQRRR